MAVTGEDLTDFVDNNKAFDPNDLSQWQTQASGRSKLQILDDIYQATEKKILHNIKQQRVNRMHGRKHSKTLMQEKLELIEENVNKKFEMDGTAALK